MRPLSHKLGEIKGTHINTRAIYTLKEETFAAAEGLTDCSSFSSCSTQFNTSQRVKKAAEAAKEKKEKKKVK